MARIFGVSEDVTNTRRAVGTYSYIAPEYAMEGLFSEKSNVFSFGVILLEIVSGRKNTSFFHDEQQSLSLIGFTWKLWKEDNFISLIDKEMHDPEFGRGILRCLHIGLLRVQELARERPTMATVVSMLNSEIINLPSPTQPAFILRQNVLAAASSQSSDKFCSFNNVSITNIQGR